MWYVPYLIKKAMDGQNPPPAPVGPPPLNNPPKIPWCNLGARIGRAIWPEGGHLKNVAGGRMPAAAPAPAPAPKPVPASAPAPDGGNDPADVINENLRQKRELLGIK